MQGILELDIVSGSGVGHGTPHFDALLERSNYRRESQSTVAGPHSCASVALSSGLGYHRRTCDTMMASNEYTQKYCQKANTSQFFKSLKSSRCRMADFLYFFIISEIRC